MPSSITADPVPHSNTDVMNDWFAGVPVETMAAKRGLNYSTLRWRLKQLGLTRRAPAKAVVAPMSAMPIPRAKTCQWHIARIDCVTHRFCDAPTHNGTSWCAEHAAVVFA